MIALSNINTGVFNLQTIMFYLSFSWTLAVNNSWALS